jgi:hypothetical protein
MRDLAIRIIHPSVITIDNEIDARDINGNAIVLDESAIAAEITKLQTAYDNAKYQRDRAEAYPSIADQLDDIYHNGVDAWKATIKAVKDKYPKE